MRYQMRCIVFFMALLLYVSNSHAQLNSNLSNMVNAQGCWDSSWHGLEGVASPKPGGDPPESQNQYAWLSQDGNGSHKRCVEDGGGLQDTVLVTLSLEPARPLAETT